MKKEGKVHGKSKFNENMRRGGTERRKISGNESSEQEEIVEQQVNIGSLYFRNEKEPCLLMLFWLFSSLQKWRKWKEELQWNGKPSENQQGFYILFIIIFLSGLALPACTRERGKKVVRFERNNYRKGSIDGKRKFMK